MIVLCTVVNIGIDLMDYSTLDQTKLMALQAEAKTRAAQEEEEGGKKKKKKKKKKKSRRKAAKKQLQKLKVNTDEDFFLRRQ